MMEFRVSSKESGKVRYAYGVATALLLGGTAFSIGVGPVGAQVAQNAPAAMAPRGAPRGGDACAFCATCAPAWPVVSENAVPPSSRAAATP